jgi:hypothetical protein
MAWMTVILWGAGALLLAFAVYYFTKRRRANWPEFSAFAQGYAALVTVVALFIAAGIYFVERKDKPSIEFEVSAARALIPARERSPAQVLLAIQIRVKNNSSRQVTMNCIALDMYQPVTGQILRRSGGAPEELLLEQLPRSAEYPRDVVPACIRREQSSQAVRPLFMWPPLVLEPNEADDRYFEVPVSCAYPFVRVLVKLRLRPEDRLSYETKALIPLREICEGAGGGMPASVSEPSTAAAGPIASAPTKQ